MPSNRCNDHQIFQRASTILLLLIFNITATYGENYDWKLLGPGDADQVTSLTVLKNGDVAAGLDIGGIYISTNNGDSWLPMNVGLSNLDVTTKVIQDPNNPDILFVGTRGGLFKSTDYGKEWVRLAHGLPEASKSRLSGSIGGLLIDRMNSNIIYLAMGYRPSSDGTVTVQKLSKTDSIYKSVDGGKSWQKYIAFQPPTKITQLFQSPSVEKNIYAATTTGLYLSEDSGMHWKVILDKITLNVAISPDAPYLIYAACNTDGILVSRDNGKTWSSVNNGLGFFNYNRSFDNRYSTILINPDNSEQLYTINSTWGQSGGLYRSDDAGMNWLLISKNMPESWLKTSRRMNDIAISGVDTKKIYLGSSRYIYASIDSGKTWFQKISKKQDGGWTNTGINVFGQTRVIKVDSEDMNTIYVGTADHKIVKSVNYGTSWNSLLSNDKYANYVWGIDQCPRDDYKLYIVTSDNAKDLCVMSSTDKGRNWSKTCSIFGKATSMEKIYVSPHDCYLLILASKNGIYKSTDQGKNWMHIQVNEKGSPVRSIAFGQVDINAIFAGTHDGLYKSIDKGNTWKQIQSTRNFDITSINIQPQSDKTIFIGTQMSSKKPGEIYKSVDGGKSWLKVLNNIRKYVSAIVTLPGNHDFIYASTLDDNYHDNSSGDGIFMSMDTGESWSRIDNNLPVHRAYDISTSFSRPCEIFLASNGSGAYLASENRCNKYKKKPQPKITN